MVSKLLRLLLAIIFLLEQPKTPLLSLHLELRVRDFLSSVRIKKN